MFDFESIKYAYLEGWATEDDLQMYVDFEAITKKQMNEILGVGIKPTSKKAK
ncbi:XkdX family protein [Enterococcus sp. AZ194]|uniref:XkdX family protein n=1 Tax=Enterococcus sp. AZ194 TaxID=2774629 RepID=UPI003F68654E